MTYSTPPGWHPDPGHTGEGPRLERWWDGSAWTDEVRSGAPEDFSVPEVWGSPDAPPLPAMPPGSGNRGRRIALGVSAGVVVLAIAGGFYLLGRNGSDDNASAAGGSTASAPPAQPGQGNQAPGGPQGPDGSTGGQGGPGGGLGGAGGDGGLGGGGLGGGSGEAPGGGGGLPQQPPAEKGFATDAAAGISIPVPKGWTGQSAPAGADVSTGNYKCPGDATQVCQRAGVSSIPSLNKDGATAKATAEKDIGLNAKESYGGKVYGKISSHQQLKSEEVTVAGQKGYLVRWKVVTSKGDDGYVQSLSFPSPSTQGVMVTIRSGFDVNDSAPKLSVMDSITKGIKAASGSGSGQGV